MIQANELRIGNWIECKGKNEKVIALAIDDIVTQNFAASNDYFNGIHLTPEILKKAGFEKDKTGVYYLDAWPPQFPSQRFYIEYKEGIGFMLRSRYEAYNESATFKLLKYLHQLQNLYFALTGEELEINI